MKKSLLFLMLSASLCLQAAPKVSVTPLGDSYQPGHRGPQKTVSTASVIYNEDFSGMTAGSADAPDLENRLASIYDDVNIPAELTHGDQWRGSKVYSAGDAVALYTLNPQDAAYLETPLRDLSGSISLSFKAKYLKVSWYDEEDGKTYSYTGSSITAGIGNDRGSTFQTSEGNITDCYPWLADVRLYPQMGWVEVNIEFDNYSAYNDAYIVFYCSDGVVIDDVKLTSSVDKFIAPPVISGVEELTETSVTVGFEPATAAFNTYYYLLEQNGYDEEGNPVYEVTMPQDEIDAILAQLEEYGMAMTWKEYREMAGLNVSNPYSMLGSVEARDKPVLTIEGLDPAKDYFIGMRSHYVKKFSEMAVLPINEIAAPEAKEATDILADSFTANWSPIVKADRYEVSLYGVNEASEDVKDFIIFEEDFENVSNYTDANDVYEADWVGTDQDITLDDLTSTPGWTSSENKWPIAKGKLGTAWWGAWIKTPDMYVGNSDQVIVSLKIEADYDLPIYLNFAGISYQIPIEDGMFEDEFILPTNGLKETWLRLACSDDFSFLVDHITVMQDLKKGDRTYTYLGTTATDETSCHFGDLDKELFDMYGYAVCAVRGEGKELKKSVLSSCMLVDLNSGKSMSRAESLGEDVYEVARYGLDGRALTAPAKGINIVRYSDGSVRKIIVD